MNIGELAEFMHEKAIEHADTLSPWQKCPKCDGQGIVSKPPWVAGDVHTWSCTSTSHTCNVCNGKGIIKV